VAVVIIVVVVVGGGGCHHRRRRRQRCMHPSSLYNRHVHVHVRILLVDIVDLPQPRRPQLVHPDIADEDKLHAVSLLSETPL
jgi:hypothetical protein